MPHPVDIKVGKNVRAFRLIAGMTQQDLAEKVGIRFQQIQKYETGANRVSASRLSEIAEALGRNISEFFAVKEFVQIDDSDIRMAARFATLTDHQKHTINLMIAHIQSESQGKALAA